MKLLKLLNVQVSQKKAFQLLKIRRKSTKCIYVVLYLYKIALHGIDKSKINRLKLILGCSIGISLTYSFVKSVNKLFLWYCSSKIFVQYLYNHVFIWSYLSL